MGHDMAQLTAAHNYVIVKPDPRREIESGTHGVVIPAHSDLYVCTGEVIAIGPTCRAVELRVGDTVLYPPFSAGNPFVVDREEYLALLDWEILGRWTP